MILQWRMFIWWRPSQGARGSWRKMWN